MEVIKYEDDPMTKEERDAYSDIMGRKQNGRLYLKRRERDQQKQFATNPDGLYNSRSKLTRGQWFRAFQYHTLVGADLETDKEARDIAAEEIRIY